MTLTHRWVDLGRDPTERPDPAYPNGKPIDGRLSTFKRSCSIDLPHPTRRCGLYYVTCDTCGLKVAITTAGRPDDPSSLTINCLR